MTRVLMTSDAIGGIWSYTLDLADGLAATGVETVIALFGPPPTAARRAEAAATPGLQLIETGLPIDWTCSGPAPVRAAGRALATLAGDIGVDLVQLNMPALGAGVEFAVPTIAVTHGCVATWWQAARGTPLAAGYRWHETAMAQGLAAANRVVAPSAAYAALVAARYPTQRPVAVVYNGRRAIAANMPGAAAESGTTPAAAALTVGRLWDPVKRAALLDDAARTLSVPFQAAGALAGPHGERVELAFLDTLGELSSTLLARRLAARPVFVSAAMFEPFGLAVLEAASAGCALVLSDIPTFAELWDEAALFVAGDDPAVWRDAIEGLIADPQQRARLGASAQRRSRDYTPTRMAAEMSALYASVLADRRTVRAAA